LFSIWSIVLSTIVSVSSDSIRLVGEKDLLELARVPRGTWSAWIRNEHFEDSDSGLYGEAEVVAAAIFNVLASALPIRKASIAWRDCGTAVTGACIQLRLDGDDPLVFAIDVHALDGAATGDPSKLFDLLHSPVPSPRGWIAIPIADLVREARRGFWKHAKPASELTRDRRRRTAKRSARPSTSKGA
jgi:hypothetical protein